MNAIGLVIRKYNVDEYEHMVSGKLNWPYKFGNFQDCKHVLKRTLVEEPFL